MTKEGFELIKNFEGCSLIAYQCPAKIWTIGYGSTYYLDNSKVQEGDKINMDLANKMLKHTVEDFEKSVHYLLNGLYLPEICIDALVCLSYNIGITAFAKSSLLKRIKEDKNNLTVIEKEFKRWIFCRGVKLKGLEKRRQAEYELYEKGILSQYSKSEIFHKCNLK
jgi:lysozyme